MNKIPNATYCLIPSKDNNYKEVLVSYNVNGETLHRFIFIPKNSKWKDKDYLNDAKKRFESDVKNNKVFKVKARRSNKPLVIATSVLGVAAVTFAGLFTWKYLTNTTVTGGGGGGGGDTPQPQPEPGPVKWKKATEKEAIETRNNVLSYQASHNVFEILEGTTNANQFIVTNRSNGGVRTYQIDTNECYIKDIDNKSSNDIDEKAIYFAFHHDDYGNSGLYMCRCEDDKDKPRPVSQKIYEADSKESACIPFVPTNTDPTIRTCVGNISNSGLYNITTSGGISIVDTFTNYLRMMDVQEEIKINYQQGNGLSFQIDHNGEYTVKDGIKITSTIKLTVENAQLTNALLLIKDSAGMSEESEISVTPAAFTLDPLDEYFPEK